MEGKRAWSNPGKTGQEELRISNSLLLNTTTGARVLNREDNELICRDDLGFVCRIAVVWKSVEVLGFLLLFVVNVHLHYVLRLVFNVHWNCVLQEPKQGSEQKRGVPRRGGVPTNLWA